MTHQCHIASKSYPAYAIFNPIDQAPRFVVDASMLVRFRFA
jgi:hypothetical protein